ncbi:MAG: transglutaminase-like domain-containing protein, partial [Anaerolineae bacterium]
MVIGYAPGTYDPEEAHYVVTEADAHAWAEVFFPGYGWIEFEPTGSRPAMDRSAEEEPIQWPEPEESLRPPAPPPNPFIRYWYLVLLGLAALAGLGGMVWAQIDLLWLRLTTSEKMVQTLYGRLRRWGDRMEVRMFEGDTPYEFTAAMKKRIVSLGQRQQQGRWVEKGLIAIEEIQRLVEDYVATLYSSRTLSDEDREVAIAVWHRLRWRFWLIWLWRYRYLYDRLFAPPTERRVPGEEWMPPTMPRF